jgi:hypothetical protein
MKLLLIITVRQSKMLLLRLMMRRRTNLHGLRLLSMMMHGHVAITTTIRSAGVQSAIAAGWF